MKNWKKVIGVASAAAMTAAMMMPASVFAADDETFKIGVIGPMTGDYAQYGTNVYNAAKIAADEINENGGFNGYNVEVLAAGDDQGDPEKAGFEQFFDTGKTLGDIVRTSNTAGVEGSHGQLPAVPGPERRPGCPMPTIRRGVPPQACRDRPGSPDRSGPAA